MKKTEIHFKKNLRESAGSAGNNERANGAIWRVGDLVSGRELG